MTEHRIQSHKDLRQEMQAVARGHKPAPADAAKASFESAEVLLRLLTPENRTLLRIIRDEQPKSVANLARLAKRAEPNLLRTLGKLEAFGLIEMQSHGRRRVPVSRIQSLSIEIDLFSQNDRFQVA